LGQAVRLTLRQGWDRIGILMAVSLTWVLLLALLSAIGSKLPISWPLALRYGVILAAMALVLPAPLAGAHYVAQLIAQHDEVSYFDMWLGARRLAGPSIRLGLIHILVLGLFAANLWFYLHLGGFVGMVAMFLCGYALLFWGMMMSLHYPLLVAQETGVFDEPERQAKRGAAAVLRRAFFLALGRPFYTFGLLAIVIPITVAFAATMALLALLWAGGVALLTTHGTRLLLIQYGIIPPPPIEEPIPDEKFRIKAQPADRR
jgi:hypothetical protein